MDYIEYFQQHNTEMLESILLILPINYKVYINYYAV